MAVSTAFSGSRPLIIAHRGGGQEWPENTVLAFEKSIQSGAAMLELDVQVTKDGVPVVYHPKDLSKNTDGAGQIKDFNVADLKALDAGYHFGKDQGYPYRGQGLKIPTLEEVLKKIPNVRLIIDMKSTPEEDLVQALVATLPDAAYARLVFYSTHQKHLEALKAKKPEATTFESRDATRARLLNSLAAHRCDGPSEALWIGFEKSRTMSVVEKFTLGEGQSETTFDMWNKDSMKCTRGAAKKAKIVFFGVNTPEDFKVAKKLGADAVFSDAPSKLAR